MFIKFLKRAKNQLFKNHSGTKLNNEYRKKIIVKWKENGSFIPPPHEIKQKIVKEYQRKFRYNIFVETGTYLGDMVEAQRRNFKKIYSIELGNDLWTNAVKRFKNNKNTSIIHGDSGKILKTITKVLKEPAIFWLDGHYSSGITAKGDSLCPVLDEIKAIIAEKELNHIILIDDARCYTGEGDFPTIEEITNYIMSKQPLYNVEIKNDVIRYVINSKESKWSLFNCNRYKEKDYL